MILITGNEKTCNSQTRIRGLPVFKAGLDFLKAGCLTTAVDMHYAWVGQSIQTSGRCIEYVVSTFSLIANGQTSNVFEQRNSIILSVLLGAISCSWFKVDYKGRGAKSSIKKLFASISKRYDLYVTTGSSLEREKWE